MESDNQADAISTSGNYYLVHIGLQNLDSKNSKLEYRAIGEELALAGYSDIVKISDDGDDEIGLPNSLYAISSSQYSRTQAMRRLELAIEVALRPYYGDSWNSKYNVVMAGEGPIFTKYLKAKK